MRSVLIALVLALLSANAHAMARIKDITTLRGLRDNQLIGYGLVVGLQGTGDTLQNAPFTSQAVQSMLDRMGINVRGNALRNRNVAAAIVTADLPPEMNFGARFDVNVSAMGDATSLMGGTLLLTTLAGSDGQIYGTAQGTVAVTGFDAQGQAATLTQGVPTAGHISNGAIVERALPPMPDSPTLMLELTNPDFNTATRIAHAINVFALPRFGRKVAYAQDERSVFVLRPPSMTMPRFMAYIGELEVDPDTVARVVVDARTGTVVIGQDVQISTVAVTQGTLTVKVSEKPQASQPAPESLGRTVVVPRTNVDATEDGGSVAIVGGTSLRTLVAGLNRIGLKPSGIIAILQAIKSAGALQAELVVE